jgi:hypothetical protein
LDYAEAVQRLGALLSLPVVADYYTRQARLTLRLNDAKASEVVEAVAGTFGCAVRLHGDILLLRAVDWPMLDEREIPEARLERWVQAKRALNPQPPALPIGELAEAAAALHPLQLSCLADFRSRDEPSTAFEWEADTIRNDGGLLRFYASLSDGERRLLSQGLTIGRLSGAAREAASALIKTRAMWLVENPAMRGVRIRLNPAEPGAEALRVFWLEILDPGHARPVLSFPTSIPVVAVQERRSSDRSPAPDR